ncbi:MAG: S9 family peptidase, partial [Sphingomonadales bacterium]|nr:S9 family peptidase [Sphingomonadales bacterium]
MKTITLAAALAATLIFASTPSHAERAPKLPVKSFAQLPQVSAMEFSPDGSHMLAVRPIKGRPTLVVQETKSGKIVTVVPPFHDFDISEAHWANNDRLLLVVKFDGIRHTTPTTETRLIGIDRDGKNAKYLVKPSSQKTVSSKIARSNYYPAPQFQHDILHMLPNDPDNILLSLDGDYDGEDEVRLQNVYSDKYKVVRTDARGIQNWAADHQGRVRYGWGVDTGTLSGAGRTTKWRRIYSDSSGKNVVISKTDIYEKGYRLFGFSLNPDHIYMYGPSPHGTNHVILYDMTNRKTLETVFEHETFDAMGLVSDPATGVPIGVTYFDEGLKRKYFDPKWKKRAKTINNALKGTTNLIVSSTTDHGLHMVRATSPEDSGRYYVYDEKNKKIDPVIEIYPGLMPEHMGTVQTVTYKARDGLAIPAILTLPRGVETKNLPTVILPHGGPHARDIYDFDWWPQFLANRGYAVLQPNFRGSTGYGDAFYEAGKQQWGLAMQDDVTDGTKWLIDEGISDPDRICIVGASYGGYAALMGVVKEPDLYKCAASINGVTDIPRMMSNAKKYIGGTAMTQHVNKDGRREISPARRAKEIKAKVLLIHAKDDRTVNIKQSEVMKKALKKAKNKARYVELEGGGHSMQTETSRTTMLTELEAFLKENIGN